MADRGESANSGLPFAALCNELAANGFAVGTDVQLSLQAVLQTIGQECRTPEELRLVLCPIFATSPAQQAEFGRIYSNWWRKVGLSAKPELTERETPVPLPRWWEREWVYWLAALVMVASVAWAGAYWLPSRPFPNPEKKIEVKPSRVVTIRKQTVTEEATVISVPLPEPAAVIWWRAHRTEILVAAAVGIALWGAYELLRWRRRRMILQRSSRRAATPPFQIALELPAWEVPFFSAPLVRTANRLLLQREPGPGRRLDVRRTVQATVLAGGYPQLRYRPEHREPTYLLLIDRHSAQDHQAAVYDQLAVALQRLRLPVAV